MKASLPREANTERSLTTNFPKSLCAKKLFHLRSGMHIPIHEFRKDPGTIEAGIHQWLGQICRQRENTDLKAGPLLLVLYHNPYMEIPLGEGFISALPPIAWGTMSKKHTVG